MIEKNPLNKHKYIAIDSNILRSLTFLNILKQTYGYVDFAKCNDPLLQKNGNYLLNLYKLILQDKLRIVIVNSVYQENRHIDSVINFVKKYCYFIKDYGQLKEKKLKEIDSLAKAYCSSYTKKGVKMPAPMQKTYNSYVNDVIPINDCYIMAEATIENCCLLTANGKDFIFNPKNQDKSSKFNDRTKGIVDINILHGYYEEEKDSSLCLVPHAFHISLFGALIKNGIDDLQITQPNEDNIENEN